VLFHEHAEIVGREAQIAEPGEERTRRFLSRRELRVSLLVGLCAIIVYNANLRSISAGDTYPARYLPFAIWHHHSIRLDPIESIAAQGRGDKAFWIVHRPDGQAISLYPVVVPTLLAPLYLPAVGYLNLRGWTDARLDYVARVMEKFCASLIAAVSAALLYLLLRRRTSERNALLLTVAYAFGTTTWMISSQALWQHGMGQLLVIGALLILTGPCTTVRAIAAGLLLGLVAGNRPPDALLAAALGVYGLFWAGRRGVLLAAGAALPMGLVLLYNLHMTGNVAGAYGLKGGAAFLEHDLFYGIAGILFSPMRGLFVFSPFLLFLALAWRRVPLDRSERGLTLAMFAGVIMQMVLYAKADWRAGISWGARYMTDLLPLLIWMLVPVVASLRRFGRICFMTAVVGAVMIEGIGAFWYTGETDHPLFAVEGPEAMRPAWQWRNAPFIASLQQTRPPFELLTEVRGTFDAIRIGSNNVDGVSAGDEVAATGWALSGHATPWQAAVIIDGRQVVATRIFFDRPDVREALHESSPAGWRIPIQTSGLAPGKHTLTAFARVSESGELRFLAERNLMVNAAPTVGKASVDLDAGARTAATRLREHQQAAGYWLTTYTKTTRFEAPSQELNTFLNAFLLDLLGPIEASAHLGDSLQRDRQYLTGQIEASGLVRYHGVPNAPGIGTLGCVITPDADDTALVWRLAPSNDVRLRSNALATLKQFRTEDGLYRTWLAPKESYQCINPGRDPNPADIAIQMHVLLLLVKAEPPAARELCRALRPVVNQDRVWVYYQVTPLVPLLRLDDLRHAGCQLELPQSRTQTSVPGQEIWARAASLLGRIEPAKDPSAAAREMQELLIQIAKDDFALVRQNPPLLYHNDLSASVSRYYWSEDVGYALWLKLYFEHAHFVR
jgi:hypothetical protein